MADCPDYYTNISLILSRVMNDVGINKESVLKRRKTNLVAEHLLNIFPMVRNEKETSTRYIFGSQTEGTTTLDLNSDTDILHSCEEINVIQDWKDWQRGQTNLLMLRDERLYPGYCKLQMLYVDVPLPVNRDDCPDSGSYCVDSDGNVIFKDHDVEKDIPGSDRHGPAATQKFGYLETDMVLAFRCNTWPLNYKQWTPINKRRDWPTPEMIQHMKSTGCFIVKAAHRLDLRNETWRISTSLAERCLMFSLNITQIRCYILLKMIVKTFIQPHLPDTISSYMCKTLLFHAIENTRKEFWTKQNLLQCVHLVLLYMLAAVLDENCPNYFNESANLFVGKVDGENKKNLASILRVLLVSRGRFLLSLSHDSINRRLATYVCGIDYVVPQGEEKILKIHQCRQMLDIFIFNVIGLQIYIRDYFNVDMKDELLAFIGNFAEKGQFQKQATRICLPFLCSFLATVDASKSLEQNGQIKPITLKLFDLSLHSDVSSSRLRFASYLYCTGQLERTLSVLQDVKERMSDSVMMCGCHKTKCQLNFLEREASQTIATTDRLAMCVMFSKIESPCCPRELQYEMFRSTEDEGRYRGFLDSSCMNLVVMDSLPYLYYLQYMTYRHLGQLDQQYTALNKLSDCVRNNEYLTHRETAYNVFGQCMEYEGLLDDAFECFRRSARIRPNNNAVRWHISLLIFRLISQS